jgi:hypothetical protein
MLWNFTHIKIIKHDHEFDLTEIGTNTNKYILNTKCGAIDAATSICFLQDFIVQYEVRFAGLREEGCEGN